MDKPVQVGGIRVIAVAELDIESHGAFGMLSVSCCKRPVAIVTCTQGSVKAFGPNGDPVPIEKLNDLLSDTPDAAQAIAEFCAI